MKNKGLISKMDKFLFIFTTIYFIAGSLFILSASSVAAVVKYDVSPYYFFFKQILFIFIGYFIGFFFILRFPTEKYKRYVHIVLLVLIGALIFLLGYGQITNSVKSWINLGLASFQPSELIKLFLVIYLGVFFDKYFKKNHSKFSFLIPIVVSVIIFFLVAAQPDYGTAAIIAFIVFFILLSLPFDKKSNFSKIKIVLLVLATVTLALFISGDKLFNEMQFKRFTYKEPCTRYTDDTGYQVCNGFIAIHNGGLLGSGIGESTQKYLYLPEAHTDFIFPIVVEELGVIIGSLIIIGYVIILFRLIKIARECYNIRNSIIVYGVFLIILAHLILNLMGIMALIPLTGVPLPFFTSGGSFALTLIFALFVVQRINIENKIYKKNYEIKNISKM